MEAFEGELFEVGEILESGDVALEEGAVRLEEQSWNESLESLHVLHEAAHP